MTDSLVSSHVYEIMKTIYTTPASESTDSARISVLQNTLSQLRLANIATLDALMTHFTRLIELTSADEAYVTQLATILAPCILRPKTETSMTMEEKFSYRLIRDLFAHKDAIFTELKRASSLNNTNGDNHRPRAISTDESNRRANMEARQKAVLEAAGSRSRAASPNPTPGSRHRRDRSTGGAETRFPIASPTAATHRGQRTSVPTSIASRQSLEVPSSAEGSPTVDPRIPLAPITNGADSPVTSATYMPGVADDEVGIEKRNSLGRSGPASRYPGRKPIGLARMSVDQTKRDSIGSVRDSVGSIGEESVLGARVGVSLTDKPMDD